VGGENHEDLPPPLQNGRMEGLEENREAALCRSGPARTIEEREKRETRAGEENLENVRLDLAPRPENKLGAEPAGEKNSSETRVLAN